MSELTGPRDDAEGTSGGSIDEARRTSPNLPLAQPAQVARVPASEPAPNYYTVAEDEVNLWDYIAILMRRRWTVAAVFAFCVVTATVLSFATTPLYEATARSRSSPPVPTS
jgi:hypothetical protein